MKVTVSLRSRSRTSPTRRRATRARALSLGTILLLQLSLAGCAGIFGRTAPLDRSRDPAIVSELQARLAAEPALSQSSFRVEANGGVVLLYGSVQGLGGWSCALRNAHLVDGVATVVDYLIIDRGPREIACQAPRSMN